MSKPAPAKYATARNPARPTLGPIVAEISRIVRGYPLMPWQRQVLNVAWELNPAYPGELWYTEGDISVPRQAGKSDVVEAEHIGGARMFRDWSSYMTAQTGKDAGKRWRSLVEHLDLAQGNRSLDWKINKGKGSEEARYLPQKSLVAPFAPTQDALHGDHNNFVTIDEQWAFSLDEGLALETAAKPGFLVPTMVQLQRVSTMGTANSTYMARNVEAGRQAIHDPESHRFYFEWSADETLADADPYGDATLAFHPAIGHTQSARRIRDLGQGMEISQWRRSFLNLPTETETTCIDLALWDSRRWNYDPTDQPRYVPARPEDQVIAWDVAADGSSATIVAAWLDGEGNPAAGLAATHTGTEWLIPTLVALAAKGYRRIVTDDTGPNATILQALASREYAGDMLSWAEYSTACQTTLDRLADGNVEHDGAQSFTDAIKRAALKRTPRAVVFDPSRSAGPIDALRAFAMAQDAAVRFLTAPVMQMF